MKGENDKKEPEDTSQGDPQAIGMEKVELIRGIYDKDSTTMCKTVWMKEAIGKELVKAQRDSRVRDTEDPVFGYILITLISEVETPTGRRKITLADMYEMSQKDITRLADKYADMNTENPELFKSFFLRRR